VPVGINARPKSERVNVVTDDATMLGLIGSIENWAQKNWVQGSEFRVLFGVLAISVNP
jgi:hypothetical protein